MKARPTQSRKGVKGGLRPFSSAPCRVKGQRPLWGLGQRPNCFAGAQFKGNSQQRRRQRSVPASNFARPQTRPQAALPPRFREEPKSESKKPGWSSGAIPLPAGDFYALSRGQPAHTRANRSQVPPRIRWCRCRGGSRCAPAYASAPGRPWRRTPCPRRLGRWQSGRATP